MTKIVLFGDYEKRAEVYQNNLLNRHNDNDAPKNEEDDDLILETENALCDVSSGVCDILKDCGDKWHTLMKSNLSLDDDLSPENKRLLIAFVALRVELIDLIEDKLRSER